MLQTLVENSVKHGIAKSRGGGEVWVKITPDDGSDRYKVFVENSGAELQVDGNSSGTGLKNTRQRLALTYGDCHEFKIASRDQKTVVEFFIG